MENGASEGAPFSVRSRSKTYRITFTARFTSGSPSSSSVT
jgi:hypothetical protein